MSYVGEVIDRQLERIARRERQAVRIWLTSEDLLRLLASVDRNTPADASPRRWRGIPITEAGHDQQSRVIDELGGAYRLGIVYRRPHH